MRKRFLHVLILLLALTLGAVLPAQADGAQPTMTINGSTENITLAFNESPMIRVLVPDGATALSVEGERISRLDGSALGPEDEHQEWNEFYDHNRLRQVIDLQRGFFDTGIWRVTAKYLTDAYDDGADLSQGYAWTTLAVLDVAVSNWEARLNAPVLTLAASSVQQGEWIRATVNSFQQKDEWYWYELARMDEDSGDWGEWFDHTDLTLKEGVTNTFAVPTVGLEPGTYRLWLRTEAIGYEDAGTFKTFIVTENDSFAEGIYLASDTVQASVRTYIGLHAAGADQMQVLIEQEGDPNWHNETGCIDGEAGTMWTDFGSPGTYHLTLMAYEGDDSRVAGTATLTVTAADYLAAPVYSGFPGVLAAGQGLTGTLVLDSRVDYCGLELCYCPEDGWETMYESYGQTNHAASLAIDMPASLFTRDGLYRLRANTSAWGVENAFADYWFIRSSSAAGSEVTLTVNGGTDDVAMESSCDIYLQITAPGATAARVMIGDRWEYCGSPDQFAFSYGLGSGDYAIVAQITTEEPVWNADGFDWGSFRWEDLEWGAYSNAVNVHVTSPNGHLARPQVTLEQSTVARGEWIRATFDSQDHGEWYWAEVRKYWREGNGDIRWDRVMECGTNGMHACYFPTAGLEPGDYYLSVGVDAVGWESAEISVPFTVTESASALPNVKLYFPGDTIMTSKDITFYAWAENADHMEVNVSWTGNPGWGNHYENGGEWGSWGWSCSESGTYVFDLEAWSDGESIGTDSFTLTVEAPYGDLDNAVLHDIPATMPVDTVLSGSFTPDANAANYGVKLVYCGPDGWWWDELYDEWIDSAEPNATTVSFPASYFDKAGIYQLEVHTNATGWNGGHTQCRILVTDPTLAENLTVTVNNGSDADILLHQDVPVRVSGPEGITAARLWSSSRNNWDYHVNVDNGLEWNWGFHQGGEETLVAQATTSAAPLEWLEDPDHDGMWGFDWDEVEWTMTSEPVTVEVIYHGDLDDPEVTFPNGTTAERGQPLEMAIHTVDNAWSYGVQVCRADDNEQRWLLDLDYPLSETTVIELPTLMLEPGDYMVYVDPRCWGWHGYSTGYPFTVTASTSQEPILQLYFQNDTILTSDFITFYAYAEGADHMAVDVTMAGNPGWNNHYEGDGELNSWGWSQSDRNTYIFTLAAWQGEDSLGEASFTLTVEAPYGDLDEAALNDIPATMPVNTALSGSFTPDDNAEAYGVHLVYCGPDGWWWEDVYDDWRDKGEPNATAISFTASCFDRAGFYQLEIHSTAYGWDGSHLNQRILVTDGSMTQNLTVTVNNGSDADILLHQDVPVRVSGPEGITAARLWSSSRNNWDYHVNVDNGLEWNWGFHQGGEETLVAQATTSAAPLDWLDDPSHDGMWDFDWDEVDWTYTSESVTVHVLYYGDLDDPEVTFPNGTTVERGQMLQVGIEPVENAWSYGVQIYRAGETFGERLVDMDYPLTQTTLISIPTVRLPAGEYEMLIDPRNWGWQGYSVSYPFTVTEDNWTDEPSFVVSSTSLLTKQEVVYSIYAPGAEEVAFCSESMEEGMWDSDWAETLTGKYPLNWVRTYHFLAFARYPGEEEWQQIGETQDVEVTAPYGPLGLTVDAPESIGTSDVLTIDIGVDFLNTTGTTNCFISPLDDHEFEPDIAEEYDEDGIHHVVYQVEAGGLRTGAYLLTVYAFPNDPGYEIAIYDGQITVTDSAVEAVLTVNPNPAEIFDNVHFDLQAPGATAVAMYGTLNGMGWVYEIGDTLQYDETAWWEDAHYVYGVYTTEPIDPEQEGFDWGNVHWEGSTGMIRLNINPPSNELEEMNVTVDRTTVKRGEKIQVTILNDNPGLDVSYGANLQPEDDQSYGGVLAWYGPEPDAPKVIWVDTLEAEPGEYSLLISANAHSCHGVSTRIPITVTEADDGAHLSIRDTNVETGNMLRAYGYASGAVQMNLNVTFENGTWGSSYSQMKDEWLDVDVFAGEHPDTMIVELIATYADGTTETVTKTIDVAAPNGPVHPAIQLDSPWQPGMDLDFTVTVEAEAQYVAFVQEPGAEEAVFAQFVPQGSPSRQFHLEGSEYAFEPGRAYEIRVVAAGTGYDGRETWIRISQSAELSTLTLPPALRTIGEEAFAGTAAQRIIVPAGVTAIGSNAFTDCPNLVELVLPEGITSFAADALGTSGPVFVYGAAGSYLEDYAAAVDNLIFIPID